jgi:Flp pilus assembly protein TadD
MTVDAMDVPILQRGSSDGAKPSASLRERGLQKLRTGDLTGAADFLSRAQAVDPDDSRTQLGLGIALQGLRRYAEALEPLERAQKSLPADPLPFLHASLSFLARGRTCGFSAALRGVARARSKAPRRPCVRRFVTLPTTLRRKTTSLPWSA